MEGANVINVDIPATNGVVHVMENVVVVPTSSTESGKKNCFIFNILFQLSRPCPLKLTHKINHKDGD